MMWNVVTMNEEILSIIKDVRKHGSFSGSALIRLNSLCGERFWKALQAVVNDLVKRYIFTPSGREAWVVVGKKRDYRVLSEVYCDCDDFYINVTVKRRAAVCYHILAKMLAEALNVFSEIQVDDMMFETLKEEWELLPEPRSSRTKSKEGSLRKS